MMVSDQIDLEAQPAQKIKQQHYQKDRAETNAGAPAITPAAITVVTTTSTQNQKQND
jgi:hypothetical protein